MYFALYLVIGCAFMRQDVSDAYPEGTAWGDVVWEDVTNISVNKNDQVGSRYSLVFYSGFKFLKIFLEKPWYKYLTNRD